MAAPKASGRRTAPSSTRLIAFLAALALLISLVPGASAVAARSGPVDRDAAPLQAGPPPEHDEAPPTLAEAPVKASDTDGRLVAVLATESEGGAAAAIDHARGLGLAVDRGRVRVVIETSRPAIARRSAVDAGAVVEAAAGGLVQVLATPGQLRALRGADGVRYLRPPLAHVEHAVTGEGVAAVNAGAWHAAGITGEGVKVAVIDGGFAGLGAAQASGDLPGDLDTADYCSGGFATASEHGTAVAEIVHEMAPAARLLLICIDTEVRLAEAVDYAKSQGVDVINHSMGWLNAGRGDGTGAPGTPDATAADAAAAGILWVNAAGNEALTHWSGTFVDAGGGWQDFGSGDAGNSFVVGSGAEACATLKWDDWPGSDQDYDLYVIDPAGDLAAWSETEQTGTQAPTEVVCFENPGDTGVFSVAIHRWSAAVTPRFDLFVLGVDAIEHVVTAGSLLEPATSPATLAAGAVCWSATVIEPFSSRGPTIDGRVKPDLVGQDGVSGLTYGAASACGTYSGFTGTSAAAPHVAGAAALVKSRHPEYGSSQLRSFLTAGALDLGLAGPDPTYGAGLLRLAATGTVVELVSTPNPSLVGQVVTLTASLTPVTATGTVTFRDVTGGGSVALGVAAVNAGVATITTPFQAGGTRILAAEYGGDGANPPAVSGPISHGVTGPVLTPTATSLALVPNPVARGTTATFTATVAPNPASGSITWIVDGVEAETTPVGPGGTSSITRTYWETGLHTLRARFAEGTLFAASESTQAVLTVSERAAIHLVADRSTAVSGETLVTFTATMDELDAGGSVTFIDVLGSTRTALGTVALAEDGSGLLAATLSARLAGTGTHQVHASYGGNATYGPNDSGPVTIAVSPDLAVSASRVGVSHGTFYPYKDGYRDTVAIRGTPGEPLSVRIKIYDADGRRVRLWSLATRTAPWSVAWNGRTDSGTRVPAGRYRVVQVLRDALGHSLKVISYTTVSNKRLYWYSGSRTKYADTGSFGWFGDGADVYRSTRYDRGVVLNGGSCAYDPELDEQTCDLAMGVHRFSLVTATAYASIRLSVLGRSRSGWGVGYEGIDDFAGDEIDVTRSIGYTFEWYPTSSVGSAGHVDGSRVVTGVVWASGANAGRIEYQKVRLTYRYALLK